jgi:hypothetical protein
MNHAFHEQDSTVYVSYEISIKAYRSSYWHLEPSWRFPTVGWPRQKDWMLEQSGYRYGTAAMVFLN